MKLDEQFATDLPETWIREKATALLLAANTLAGQNVQASRVWPVTRTENAACIVYTDRGTATDVSGGNSEPQFKAVVTLTIDMQLRCATRAYFDAQTSLALAQMRNAILGAPEMRDLVERFGRYAFTTEFDQEDQTIGTARLEIDCEFTDRYPPYFADRLSGVNLYVDAVNRFDPNGSYAKPFAYYVARAPRAAGPDGRVEIGGSVEF